MSSVIKMNLFLVCIISASSLCSISADVPVFTWSNRLDLPLPQVFAGHSKSQAEFKKEYLNFEPSTLLMFVQKEISITDILINGGVYGSSEESNYDQLKSMMENYISAYIPAVERPVETILKKAKEEDFVFKKVTQNGLKEGRLQQELQATDSTKRHLIVVDFTEFAGSNQKKIDSWIGSIIKYFKDSEQHFHAFYTAKHDQVYGQLVVEGGGWEGSRHLLATKEGEEGATEKTTPPLADGNFIISFDHLGINNPSVNHSIKLQDVSVLSNDCKLLNTTTVPSAFNCSVVLGMGSMPPYSDLKLKLWVATSGKANEGFWYVRRMSLSFKNGTQAEETAEVMAGLTDPTPLGLSYSCNEAPPFISKTTVKGTTSNSLTLYFKGLQIQAFATHPPNFGHYNDCVGFFSTAIWMFLITAAILIVILLFGITMVMSINTMDRYDDPKGKTISVANAE